MILGREIQIQDEGKVRQGRPKGSMIMILGGRLLCKVP